MSDINPLIAKYGDSKPVEPINPLIAKYATPVSQLESGLRGAAQGATLGFADELAGAGGAGLDLLTGKTAISKLVDAYRKNRDESRSAYAAAQKQNPGTYLSGQLGGGLATLAIPGLNVAKGAQLAQAIKAGALAGGIGGLGSSEADLTKPDIGNYASAAGSTALGTALGAGTSGLLHTAFNPSTASKDIATMAAKEHLRATPKFAANIGEEGLNNAALESLKQGVIRPGATAKTTAKNLESAIQKIGAEKGAAVNTLVKNGAAMPTDQAVNSLDSAVNSLDTTSSSKSAVSRLKEFVDNFKNRYANTEAIPLDVLEKEKTDFQSLASTAYRANEPTKYQQGLMSLAKSSKDLGESAAESAGNKMHDTGETRQALQNFLASKKSLSNLYPAEQMAERTGSLTHGGLMPHITDTGIAATAISGLSHGNPLPLLMLPARALTKGRVASTIASGAYGASKLLNKIPNIAGQYAAPVAGGLSRAVQQPSVWEQMINRGQ